MLTDHSFYNDRRNRRFFKTASLISSLDSWLARNQAGEKRFAKRLESHQKDEYLGWYELPVGKRQRYSDFIVLHPARGLLLLEVKDWKLDTIRSIDRISATILTPRGQKAVSNPVEQVRRCAYRLLKRLERDPRSIAATGRYQRRPVISYGCGVVPRQYYRGVHRSCCLRYGGLHSQSDPELFT